MSQTLVVGISDMKVAQSPDILVTYALGSCIGICLHDQRHAVGGLAHIMLPSSSLSNNPKDIYKFADTAIPQLLINMERMGAQRRLIRAKIAGGAQMFAAISNSSIANIGQRNIAAVKDALGQLRIPIIAEDVGSNYGRTVYFYSQNGTMKIKSVNRGEFSW